MGHLCSDCGKSIKNVSDMKKHILVVHTKSAKEICPVCGESFLLKFKLKNHMASNHEFKKDFQCDLCSKTFLASGGLLVHKRVCQERKHVCSECPKTFKRKSHLQRHQSGHLGEKIYACTNCEKRFIHKYSLTQHMLEIHVNPNSHKCEVCTKSFSKRNGLNVHMEAVHNKEYMEQKQMQLNDVSDISEPKLSISEYFRSSTTESVNILEEISRNETPLIDDDVPKTTRNDENETKNEKEELKDNKKVPTAIDHSCSKCTYSTNKMSNFKYHIYYKHGEGEYRVFYKNNSGKYDCGDCEFVSEKLSKLKQHVSVHVNIEEYKSEEKEIQKIDSKYSEDKNKYSKSKTENFDIIIDHPQDLLADTESEPVELEDFNWTSLDDEKEDCESDITVEKKKKEAPLKKCQMFEDDIIFDSVKEESHIKNEKEEKYEEQYFN